LAALIALIVCLGPVSADMTITLKDGRRYVLPITPEDIEAIEFDGAAPPGAPVPKPAVKAPEPAARAEQKDSPAARAARKEGRLVGKSGTGDAGSQGSPLERLAAGRVLRVGPNRQYKSPGQAARDARDNDVVEIDAGLYRADVAVWSGNNLTIKAVGGRVHLDAAGRSAEGKATWVIRGRNATVEGIEFSGAHVPHLNGAGIRLEGASLTIRNCYFHDNEMGILTGHNAESDIVIEYSEFARNTVDYRKTGRLGHNIYVGNVRSFTLRHSYVHEATIGHNVKSRAKTNKILYNRIMDGPKGGSSYLVDLPIGGRSYIIGNIFHQSPKNDNKSLISYTAEGTGNTDQRLYVVNNTFVNDDHSGTFVQNRSDQPAIIRNNIMVGPGVVVSGPADVAHNLLARPGGDGDVNTLLFAGGKMPANSQANGNRLVEDAGLADRAAFDYHLTKTSPAINTAGPPGIVDGFPLTPGYEYVAPDKTVTRKAVGPLDIGAYEFGGS
jgi:hypothetical protein